MVTKPACGIPAAPIETAVDVKLEWDNNKNTKLANKYQEPITYGYLYVIT